MRDAEKKEKKKRLKPLNHYLWSTRSIWWSLCVQGPFTRHCFQLKTENVLCFWGFLLHNCVLGALKQKLLNVFH